MSYDDTIFPTVYVVDTFAILVNQKGRSVTIQGCPDDFPLIKKFPELNQEGTMEIIRIFTGGYKKPKIYKNISMSFAKTLIRNECQQQKLLYRLGHYLSPLVPSNVWNEFRYGIWFETQGGEFAQIDIARAIEQVNDLAKTVGITIKKTSFGNDSVALHKCLPKILRDYINRMSKRQSVLHKAEKNILLAAS